MTRLTDAELAGNPIYLGPPWLTENVAAHFDEPNEADEPWEDFGPWYREIDVMMELRSLVARISELEGALGPFASAFEKNGKRAYDNLGDNPRMVEINDQNQVLPSGTNLGHYRRAFEAPRLSTAPDLLADLIASREALRRLVKQLRTGDDSDIADAVQAAKEALDE